MEFDIIFIRENLKKKKEKFQQIPLQIELEIPEKFEQKENAKEIPSIIIIDIF